MKLFRVFAALAVLLSAGLLAGCISIPMGKPVGALSNTFEGQHLVIYREMDRGGMYFNGEVDDTVIKDSLTAGSVTIVPVTAGSHTFTVKLPPFHPGSKVNANTVSVTVAKNERKFIRVRLSTGRVSNFTTMTGAYAGTMGTWNFLVEEVDPVTGADAVKALKFAS